MASPEIDLVVYPDLCDAFGHLNQAAFLTLFERARWEMLSRGPGMDLFTRERVWPAVRKATIEYVAQAFPGDVLRFQQTLTHVGRTSFSMRQAARRVGDDTLIATAEFTFVCIGDAGRPVPVPRSFADYMNDSPPDADVRRVTVNGVSLAVDVAGDGPAVLFVHGYPLDRTLWRHQVEHLDRVQRIAPDLRGMGKSDAPDLGYSMATYADDLLALLDALGRGPVVLVGLSMGGYVCFELLRRARERVKGLVLVDTRAEADSSEGRRKRDAAAQLAREQGAAAIAAQMLPQLFAAETADAVGGPWREVERMIGATPVPGIVGALTAMRDRPDSSSLLVTLADIPSLVLVGEDDRITPPATARHMAELLPKGRLRVIAGAGHLAPLERPEEVTRALAAFLDEIGWRDA